MDELAATNRDRWNALVAAGVEYTRPFLELTVESARAFLDPLGIMGDVAGKQVLCLGSGGGQQSVAFSLLGAKVTVLDLSDKQLERDRAAADHYRTNYRLNHSIDIRTVQGDMRHLDEFATSSFDLVYHAYSINFVPNVAPVLAEVARVIRPGGLYRIEWANPFIQMIDSERDWDGTGYVMRHEYLDGREATELYPTWTVGEADGGTRELDSPREFVHTLSTLVNTLATNGFVLLRVAEDVGQDPTAPPGSWNHFKRIAPPYLTLWARYRPEAFAE
ncbi:MAG: class I SAM-dependent methyltransferase [Caldilineaceae bacterium]|nr:class I SAM-dependent methyltransferase [Caldilineaceae bacterium]